MGIECLEFLDLMNFLGIFAASVEKIESLRLEWDYGGFLGGIASKRKNTNIKNARNFSTIKPIIIVLKSL